MKVLHEQHRMRFRSVCLASNDQTASICCRVSRKVPTRKQNYLVCLHGHWTQPATPRLPILCDRGANQFRYDSVSPFAARIVLSSIYTALILIFVTPTDQLTYLKETTKWLRLQKLSMLTARNPQESGSGMDR
jgi:hypothetical protein